MLSVTSVYFMLALVGQMSCLFTCILHLEAALSCAYLVVTKVYLDSLSILPGNVYFSTSLHSPNTHLGGNGLIIPVCSISAFINNFFKRTLFCSNIFPVNAINSVFVNRFEHILSTI